MQRYKKNNKHFEIRFSHPHDLMIMQKKALSGKMIIGYSADRRLA